MNINDKYLNLPPYVSTSWEHVAALHIRDGNLIITLINGAGITVPDLTEDQIASIFKSHGCYLEREAIRKKTVGLEQRKPPANFPYFANEQQQQGEQPFIRFGFGAMDGLGSSLQHNPSQANSPDLPPEVLNKISQVAKVLAPDDIGLLPKPEPHCNCFHCQIARTIHKALFGEQPLANKEEPDEEIISEEELRFQQWDITQTGDKLFSVVNKLDPKEKYSVYLGQPVGCTCGKAGCEHILVVLNS